MEDLWLRHAKKLHAIASTGASFTKDPYDKQRYDEIAQIAVEMLAQIGSVPVQRIKDLIGPYSAGYVTPKVDVRGVVFRANQLLLVKESTDGKWALPGGFADIGLSPAENIAKEILEEAGIEVKVHALIGIRHKPKASYAPDARDFYKLFFGCEMIRRVNVRLDAGIAGWGYFGQNDIPDLSTGRTIAADIDLAFAYRLNSPTAAFFE